MNYLLENATGAALIAIAATNKPHLRQRGGDITVFSEAEGKPTVIRIPVARRGIYKHPRGKINFTQDVFNQMIENHRLKVVDNPVHLDLRHKDTEGALAWLDPDDGGYLAMEGDWLVAYGPATDAKAVELIKSKRYRFSSAEYTPDYRSNLETRLSADEMEFIGETEVTPMKVTIAGVEFEVQETDGGLVLTQEQLDKVNTAVQAKDAEAAKVEPLEAARKDADKKVTKLEAKVVELEAKLPKAEPEVPEAYRLRLEALEAERNTMALERETERVAFTLEQARNRRVDGRGINEATLDFFKGMLLLEKEPNVKLENESDPEAVVRFMRGKIKTYLLEVCPADVPMDGNTEPDPDETRITKLESLSDEVLKEKVETFWS